MRAELSLQGGRGIKRWKCNPGREVRAQAGRWAWRVGAGRRQNSLRRFLLGKGKRRGWKQGPFSTSDILWLREDSDEGVDYIWQFLIICKGGRK